MPQSLALSCGSEDSFRILKVSEVIAATRTNTEVNKRLRSNAAPPGSGPIVELSDLV